MEEVENLKKQVAGLLKASEEAQIGRADTINRLTRSLEDSQRQCQDLLEAGTGQELSKIKLQLQEVIASKSITEDMNGALQVQDDISGVLVEKNLYFVATPSAWIWWPHKRVASDEESNMMENVIMSNCEMALFDKEKYDDYTDQ